MLDYLTRQVVLWNNKDGGKQTAKEPAQLVEHPCDSFCCVFCLTYLLLLGNVDSSVCSNDKMSHFFRYSATQSSLDSNVNNARQYIQQFMVQFVNNVVKSPVQLAGVVWRQSILNSTLMNDEPQGSRLLHDIAKNTTISGLFIGFPDGSVFGYLNTATASISYDKATGRTVLYPFGTKLQNETYSDNR